MVPLVASLPMRNIEGAPLKDPKAFSLIGTSIERLDIPPKVDGSAVYGIDIRVPNMLFAVVARCPTFGGKPAHSNQKAALAVAGVKQVFEIPSLPRLMNTSGGVAVVADSTWAAIQGRRALAVQWDRGPNSAESSETLRSLAETQLRGAAIFVAREEGRPEIAEEGSPL